MVYQNQNKFNMGLWGVLVFVLTFSPTSVFAFETRTMSLSQKLIAGLEAMVKQDETERLSDASVPTSLRYEVQKNETMLRIAEKTRPAHITVPQMMLAFQRENPNAFYGDNVSFLIEDAVLIISDMSTLNLVSAKKAQEEISRQNDAWVSVRQDNKQLKSTVLSDQSLTLKEKMIESQRLMKEKEALIAEMSRKSQVLMSSQLANQHDELTAKDLGNQALVKRLSILEEEQANNHADSSKSLEADQSGFFSDMNNTIIMGLALAALVLFFWFFRNRKMSSSVQISRSAMNDEKRELGLEKQGLVNNNDALVGTAAASFSKEMTDADESDYRLDEDIDTKLDLAKAYIEMGDDKSGMGLLFEVLKDGSSKQKKEAQDIMKLY